METYWNWIQLSSLLRSIGFKENSSWTQTSQWERENINELLTKTQDPWQSFFWMDSIESVMQFAVVLNEITQIETDANVIIKVRKVLWNEKITKISWLAYRLVIVKQTSVAAFYFVHLAPVNKRRRKQIMKDTYLLNTGFSHSKELSLSDSEEENRHICRALRRRQIQMAYLSWKKVRWYPGIKELMSTNPLYVDAHAYQAYRIKRLSEHCSSHRQWKVCIHIKRLVLKLSRHHCWLESPQQSSNFLVGSVQRQTFESFPDPKLLLVFLYSSVDLPGANTRLKWK